MIVRTTRHLLAWSELGLSNVAWNRWRLGCDNLGVPAERGFPRVEVDRANRE
jgi:hypothetical protein